MRAVAFTDLARAIFLDPRFSIFKKIKTVIAIN